MAFSLAEFENFKGQINTIEDCEKKIKVLKDLFDKEEDDLERLELNKYILRLQTRLAALRIDSINEIFKQE
ncbi:hypothetical protein [Adhaeribacter aquaticus]|uniref:hypothetical protein n=1 Tax=Adhaeribacter aquaticus TaxID=299567 RepID=UPI0004090D33|nr:hypothetical protein [Adhaeribacter aquaticus]